MWFSSGDDEDILPGLVRRCQVGDLATSRTTVIGSSGSVSPCRDMLVVVADEKLVLRVDPADFTILTLNWFAVTSVLTTSIKV